MVVNNGPNDIKKIAKNSGGVFGLTDMGGKVKRTVAKDGADNTA